VTEVMRYYTELKRADSFHRRVTWVKDDPSTALQEYAGDYPTEVEPHGLAKKRMRSMFTPTQQS